ncbi:MAG: DAK2 domain-containing protein [Treponema sp.]|nr:DAK2 domain-containing protein [Treponema sp.]
MAEKLLDGTLWTELIAYGTGNLEIHSEEINNLNVFPIPDGDTGSNMLLTMTGGKNAETLEVKNLSSAAIAISKGMLLSARGNSGVILSQFFDGISAGFSNLETADILQLGNAFKEGVKHAYNAVMQPVEGTILTVVKDATEYACSMNAETILEFIENFIEEAKLSLERTPNLLPVLKKAGVVDSGGAGLIYIMEGMKQFLRGEKMNTSNPHSPSNLKFFSPAPKQLDLDKFTSDSVLEFGYCTELLLRLQNAKTNVEAFSVETIKNYLETIGDSIVAFKTGSIIKVHVHTKTPDKVLAFCQQYGEFLTIKIENMSLQHNNLDNEAKDDSFVIPKVKKEEELKDYGLVAVAAGEGIKQMFLDNGADYIVDGGQSMNPSAEDFINAFNEVNAKTIFVFPNNSNVILAAKQAAKMYDKADIKVLESHSIGEGYAALTMMDTSSNDTDQIIEDFKMAMEGISTYYISHCVRDAEMDGINLRAGDYIGFLDKKILVSSTERKKTAMQTIEAMDFTDHEICLFIRGVDSTSYEAQELEKYLKLKHPGVEIYSVEGGQDIYSYILIVE